MANRPASPNPSEIVTEDLHKAFGQNRVLHGIDLAIARGDGAAIVGGSGCGKTVLLNLILGQLAPDRGRVLVANHKLPDAPLCDVATLGDDIDRVHQHLGGGVPA
jgi:phospholipid/cholesterol/gamma-HCH transport system ATP-binding protein